VSSTRVGRDSLGGGVVVVLKNEVRKEERLNTSSELSGLSTKEKNH
jgi:hypothetical protein